MDITEINQELRFKTPHEIIAWALSFSKRPIVTTNFGPYSATLLHAISLLRKNMKVIWIDTGYNTSNTYKYADEIVKELALNVKMYVPEQTRSFRDVSIGIPDIGDPNFEQFTNQVKLEPFKRAMNENDPDCWFTNLRRGQTAYRDSLDIVSISSNGVIKVSPFYYWSDEQIEDYLIEHNLPNELKYFDPTKVLKNRECGLHTL